MPQNKRESLIYTIMMCFFMVLWMSVYNVAIHMGELSMMSLKEAWIGFPLAYTVAISCDLFIVSRTAKNLAFRYLLRPDSSQLRNIVTISSCMVIPMVILMSLYGAFEVCLRTGEWNKIVMIWFTSIALNFIMALPVQLLLAGPIIRRLFRKAFPVGKVLA